MQPVATRERIRCRLIGAEDLGAIVDLLCEGFSGRPRESWERCLALLSERALPDDAPRYGYCLDTGNRLVGVILLIASNRMIEGKPTSFTNVTSWYVNPNYRAYAQLLVSVALRNKDTTYTNVSAAPHTWSIVENQGYTRYCNGLFFAAALLQAPLGGVRILPLGEPGSSSSHEMLSNYAVLRRHQQMGCQVVVCDEGDKATGLIFRRYRIRSGRLVLPAMLVIHAPDRPQLIRIAGNLGRYFAWKAAPILVMDADGPVEGLKGIYTETRGRKYFKGPHRPFLCDLADSEFAILGV